GGLTSLRGGRAPGRALMRRHPGPIRGALTLLDAETGGLYVESSLGLPAEARLARYRVGEGITGEVVVSGRPIVVPDVAREPRFLHRTLRRGLHPEDAITFACVPILVDP